MLFVSLKTKLFNFKTCTACFEKIINSNKKKYSKIGHVKVSWGWQGITGN